MHVVIPMIRVDCYTKVYCTLMIMTIYESAILNVYILSFVIFIIEIVHVFFDFMKHKTLDVEDF